MKVFQVAVALVFLFVMDTRASESQECPSPQFIKEDSEAIVRCSFQEGIFSVLWYNSTDFFPFDDIITLKNSIKSGRGFISGEFDIYPNGSLIITNVSLEHEGTYTVIKLDTPTVRPITYTIIVLVFARSFDRVPSIERCNHNHEMCFQPVHPDSEISCTVANARPAIPLSWMVRTIDGDRNITSRSLITNETNTYFTSRATTPDPFAYSGILTLLVCKADAPSGLLERNESIVLLLNRNETLMKIKPNQIVVEADSTVQLHCNSSKLLYLVWQVKQSSKTVFRTILYVAFVGGNHSYINDRSYKLQRTSLVINKIRVQDEGTYRSVSGNGLEDDVIVYDVIVFGTESTTDENVSSDGHSYWIIGVVLAVVLVILLVLCGVLLLKVCGRRGKKRKWNYSEHKNINLAEGEKGTRILNGDKHEEQTKKQYMITPEEIIPMIAKDVFQEKRGMFISQLKAKYQDLYDAVQPIPYIRDRLYCVDRVFVEGGIEYLVAKNRIGGQGTWEKLSSYHNILDDERVKSTRRIIEGEPGYGKSTLTLQLSYDWCNKIQLSYLKDIDLLILLRLRQLGGVTSVYRAIKQFLLPKDSKLTESDIADIISECYSVLVILDGYDEYPDQDVNVDSDVISIIMRNMFQQFEVILTPRSSYLPKKYPAITKRLKLTGFDDNARDQYIRKAVVGDDVTAAENIKQRLKGNPVLGDLCQVPLLFVMFAHMSHESKQFRKFNSVTSFFRYMISCFHSHIKNKTKDDNVKKYDLFVTEHTELDKLAFEGLNRKDRQIVWSKPYMCKRLGQDFYDRYVSIGILVEEEVLDISDDPNAIISEHIQYKTEVRFYHKLFCEWYAAHHLAQYASRDDATFDPWKETKESKRTDSDELGVITVDFVDKQGRRNNFGSQTNHYFEYLDPFDLQYVYRFACGLKRVAAEKIIGYLKTRKDATNFAILCILEKSEKVEDVLKDVKDLCSAEVQIKQKDTLLLQRSTIQLLEIALANKISISCVYLYECYSTVDLLGGNHLHLKSDLSIPVLTTLKELRIWEKGREITSEEFRGILQYSSKCLALKKLLFFLCLLPPSVQSESLSVLGSRNVEVFWGPSKYSAQYQLNLQSCFWDYKNSPGREMTDEDYQKEVREVKGFQQRRKIKQLHQND